MEKVISMNELFAKKEEYNILPGIKSFATFRNKILRDSRTNNLLELIITPSESGATGTRYLIPIKNIEKFNIAISNNSVYVKN